MLYEIVICDYVLCPLKSKVLDYHLMHFVKYSWVDSPDIMHELCSCGIEPRLRAKCRWYLKASDLVSCILPSWHIAQSTNFGVILQHPATTPAYITSLGRLYEVLAKV